MLCFAQIAEWLLLYTGIVLRGHSSVSQLLPGFPLFFQQGALQ